MKKEEGYVYGGDMIQKRSSDIAVLPCNDLKSLENEII